MKRKDFFKAAFFGIAACFLPSVKISEQEEKKKEVCASDEVNAKMTALGKQLGLVSDWTPLPLIPSKLNSAISDIIRKSKEK